MAIVFKNNASTTLSAALSSSATSVSVADATKLPSITGDEYFFCTIDDGSNVEIVKVTGISSNTLTVVRAQDNTTALSFSSGDIIEQRLTAAVLETFPQLDVGELTADEFIGDLRGAVIFNAQAGEAIDKGEVVYVSGISGNTPVVALADADDANKMPAFGLALESASLNNSLAIVTFGTISGVDTDTPGFSLGDTLYVSTTPGGLTNSPPGGESSLIQNIGKVQRVHASSGSIKVGGAGRTNAVPNLNDGNIFIGNSSNQATTASLNTKIEDYLDANGTTFPDNVKAQFGAGNDLQIYHDGNNSYIKDGGVGDLRIWADNPNIATATGNKIFFGNSGAAELYFTGGAKRLATTSTGIDVTGNVTLAEYLYHSGNTGTNLRFQTDRATLTSGGGASVDAHSNGNLYLTGTTVQVYGNYNSTGTISSGQLNVNAGAINTTAVFESTDDKAFIRIKDDDTDTYLISKDGNFSIGGSSSDYDNFKVNISNGNTVIDGTISSGAITSDGDSIFTGSTADTTANVFIAKDSTNVELFKIRNDGVVFIPHNYLYVNSSQGIYSTGSIKARGGITNDGGNNLSISSGSSDITFNSKNFISVGTINSGAITSTGNSQVANLTVTGDLTVQGTTVTIDAATLNVEDKNITLNYSTGDSSASANGAGITIQDAVNSTTDATILWDATNDEFDFSHPVKVAGSIGVTNIVTNKVVKFDGSVLDDSNITDTGSAITLGSQTTVSGDLTVSGNQIYVAATNARVKLSVWSNTTYGIGMHNTATYGGINNDYAMTFQMNNDVDRGFLWLDSDDTLAQGAMALTTDGYLTVAEGLRIGYGKNDTTKPGTGLDVSGTISSGSIDSSGNIDANGKFIVQGTGTLLELNNSGWNAGNQTHDILYGGWTAQTGDYIYLSAAGNSNTGCGTLLVTDGAGFYYGTHSSQGAITASATDPLSDVKFRVDGSGNITEVGNITTQGNIIHDSVVIDDYSSGTVAVTVGRLQIRSPGKTGWGVGDELGAIEFYNSDGSGIGARTAARIVAENNNGNGSTTTTFEGELAFYTSAYNSNLNASPALLLDNSNNATVAGTVIADDLDISGSLALGSTVTLSESAERADLLEISSTTSGWAGLQIRNTSNEGRWSFMTNGAQAGIYDDENNDWHIIMNENSGVSLHHNTNEKLATTSTGIDVTGNIVVTGTVDGVDIAARDAVLTSTTTTANAAMPKSGGTFTGNVTMTGADAENAFTLSGSSPTMAFTDTSSGADDFYIHVNSNNFYILTDRGGAGGYSAWETPHPLQLEADTNVGYLFANQIYTTNYHPEADTLTTARTIGGVSFDGSANINLPGVNTAGNQNTSGTAAGLSGTPNITVAQINTTTGADATPAIIATNTGGVGSTIQRWVGDSDSMEMQNTGTGDYKLLNTQQNNGINFYDGTGGVEIQYSGSTVQEWDSTGGTNLTTGSFKVGGTTVIDSSRNLNNINDIDMAATDTAVNYLHVPRGGGITLYGDNSVHHGIFSRNQSNAVADDILISSYGAVYIDLDSNSNNSDAADFVIGRHNSTSQNFFSVDGENGNVNIAYDNAVLQFGIPGNGSNVNGCWASLEGNTDTSGEGSGRLFFREHNSTTASMDNYGMSIGYRGGSTAVTTAGGNSWGGLADIDNGQWGMWGHDNNLNGSLIMYGDRQATFVDFAGNNIQGITDIYVADQIIHTGDTNTYFQFHAADQCRIVCAGAEVMEWGANYAKLSDNDTLRLGAGSDFRMWHNGTDHYFRNYNHAGGSIYFQGEDTEGTNHALLYMQNNVSRPYLRLFENGQERLRTTSYGVEISGVPLIDGEETLFTNANAGIYFTNGGTNGTYASHGGIARSNGASFHITGSAVGDFCISAEAGKKILFGETNAKNAEIDASGNFTATSNVTAYSDERLKDNIQTIENGLETVKQLRGVSFTRNDIDNADENIGVIAQEVEKVLPQVVLTHDDGIKSVSYGNMVGLLIEAIKEQQEQIESLKSEINNLKGEN